MKKTKYLTTLAATALGAGVFLSTLAAPVAATDLAGLKEQGFARIAIANEPPWPEVTAGGEVSGVQARRFDMVAAGLFIKPERCAAVAFSEPDLCDAESFMLRRSLSGGGLISGVAAALKAKKPGIRVIGVSMERGAAMYECQKAGKPIQVAEQATLADSLGGGIGLDNRLTFNMVRDLVDDILLVSEAEINAAVRYAYWLEQQVVEGSGSVGIAALLTGRFRPQGPTVALLSGGNIDMRLHNRIINGEDVDIDTWEPEDA